MPDYSQRNDEGLPTLSQIAVDGSHALVYVNNPALTMMTNQFRTATLATGPGGTPCLRFDLTQPTAGDECLEATRIALDEFNGNN